MDLDALSLDELKKLRKDVEKAITSFEARKKREALAALESKAAELGFSLSELTGAAKKSVAAPKYRNPADSSQTWSGRGRQPEWYKAALAGGASQDDLKI
ncbi:H-NS histone family protein [Roseobacteraceae bacterium S113]